MSEPQQPHGPKAPGPHRVAPESPACGVAALARRFTTVRRAAPCRPGFRAATRLARDYEIGSSHLRAPQPRRGVEPFQIQRFALQRAACHQRVKEAVGRVVNAAFHIALGLRPIGPAMPIPVPRMAAAAPRLRLITGIAGNVSTANAKSTAV
jgi:hypothetical protein